MKPRVVILATLDTKADEAAFLAERIREGEGRPLVVDVGVLGAAGCEADISRREVAAAGGRSLDELIAEADRGTAAPVMAAGARALVSTRVGEGEIQAVIGLGGTQGTTLCTSVMQSLPYGLPKIMVSTVASGDTSPFVGVKDITMMFSVGDLLGLNPFTRQVLAHAAGAALGMAGARLGDHATWSGRPVVGMTNLGVLTAGALEAIRLLEAAGREVIVFHAVGSGGRTALYLPEGGTSRYAVEGGPLHDPTADRVFIEALEARLGSRIPVRRLPYGVEDPAFVGQAVEALLAFSR